MSKSVLHSERAHALLSASSSHRWLNCTASARLEEGFPESGPSSHADEGTLAHELAELKLRSKLKLLRKEKSTPEETTERRAAVARIMASEYYCEEMEECTDQYVAYVMEAYNVALAKDPLAELFIETKLDYSDYAPEGFGTCDVFIFATGVLHTIDFKYGKGVRVSAAGNSQLKIYSLAALNRFDSMGEYSVKDVNMHIFQPRLGSIDVDHIFAETLYHWADETLRPAAREAFDGPGVQVTGDWCTFCKAKPQCGALRKEAMMYATKEFGDEDQALSTDADLLEVFELAPRIKAYLEAVNKHIYSKAIGGYQWEGLKLVAGKSPGRKFTDVEAVKETLLTNGFQEEELIKSEMISLTAIQKLTGKPVFDNLLGKYITTPPGKPSLVPVTDKRQAITLDKLAAAVEGFGEEEEYED